MTASGTKYLAKFNNIFLIILLCLIYILPIVDFPLVEDELATIKFSNYAKKVSLEKFNIETNPYFFYFLESKWLDLVDTLHPLWVRLPNIFAGVATFYIFCTFRINSYSRAINYSLLTLFIFNSSIVSESISLRGYSFLNLGLAIYLTSTLKQRKSLAHVGRIIMCYSHYIGLGFVAFEQLIDMIKFKKIRSFCFYLVITLPLFYQMWNVYNFNQFYPISWIKKISPLYLYTFFRENYDLNSTPFLMIVFFILCSMAIANLLRINKSKKYVFAKFAMYFFVLAIISIRQPVLYDRTFVFFAIVFLVAATLEAKIINRVLNLILVPLFVLIYWNAIKIRTIQPLFHTTAHDLTLVSIELSKIRNESVLAVYCDDNKKSFQYYYNFYADRNFSHTHISICDLNKLNLNFAKNHDAIYLIENRDFNLKSFENIDTFVSRFPKIEFHQINTHRIIIINRRKNADTFKKYDKTL